MRLTSRRDVLLQLTVAAGGSLAWPWAVKADPAPDPNARPGEFSTDEVVESGHRFFGTISRGLAEVVEAAARRWGRPNGYILGQEASGAFVGGLRYGEGTMYTRNAGDLRVFSAGSVAGFRCGCRRRSDHDARL